MTLLRTSLLNAIAVFIKILALLGINKILAVYVGPIGYAFLGQFQNALTMMSSFATGAVSTAVTKYTAEYYENESQQHLLWQTAVVFALIGCLCASSMILFFSKFLSLWFLKEEAYSGVFSYFAIALIFLVFNAFFLAILNGKKEIGRFVIAQIAGNLLSLILTFFLVLQKGLYGALVALTLFQALSFFASFFLCWQSKWFQFSYFFGSFSKLIAKDLAKYALMGLSTALAVPISHLFIRNYLALNFGWESAGLWEAMWRLSTAYLMAVTTTLSVYYLPRLAEIKSVNVLKGELIKGYQLILPVAILSAALMFCLRDLIISFIFSADFYPVRELFLGQVIGDVLKIGSWILAFTMIGKAMTAYFIFTEILFSLSFYLIVVLMTSIFGFSGVSWAYAINYLLYWVAMYFIIFRKIGSLIDANHHQLFNTKLQS